VLVHRNRPSDAGFDHEARTNVGTAGVCSQMPYCLDGDTRILKADGRTVRIANLQVGESIYGTAREGAWRRFQITSVLARWSRMKAAYSVTLEDGTKIVASAEHRFLTRLGWKQMVGGRKWTPARTTSHMQ
jgi:hypothetical protein